MMKLIVKYVIGGETGTREVAVLAWLLWLALTAYLLWVEFTFAGTPGEQEKEVMISMAVWAMMTPFAWGWMAIAFGLNKVIQQTNLNPSLTRVAYRQDPPPPEVINAVHQSSQPDYDDEWDGGHRMPPPVRLRRNPQDSPEFSA